MSSSSRGPSGQLQEQQQQQQQATAPTAKAFQAAKAATMPDRFGSENGPRQRYATPPRA